MLEPKWILIGVILEAHKLQILGHGGSIGIRDRSLLESALNAPKNCYHYEDPKPSLEKLAASYAHSITRNHPFVDGNKRISLIACEIFLEINGKTLTASEDEKYVSIFGLAERTLSLQDFSSWIEQYVADLK